MTAAQKLYETLLDQWKSGKTADLKLHCEHGRLKVTLNADLGPWVQPDCPWSPVFGHGGLHKVSPGRLRRRERRAAERAAAEKAAANCAASLKAAAAEEADTQRAATVEVDAKKAAAVEVYAKKSAAVKVDAKKVADVEIYAKNAAAVKIDAEKADFVEKTDAVKAVDVVLVETGAAEKSPAEKVAVDKSPAPENAASTSCLGSEKPADVKTSCWNCDMEMSPEHHCNSNPGEGAAATAKPPLKSKVLGHRPSPSAPVILKGKVRMLDGSPAFPPRPKRVDQN